MIVENLLATEMNFQQQAKQALLDNNYSKAVKLYEQAIEAEPDNRASYWYLGLVLLLQEQEVEAQTTWLLGIGEADPEQIEERTNALIQVLDHEANRRDAIKDYFTAWTIRQHIREIAPTNLSNILQLIDLALELKTYTGEELTEWEVISLLQTQQSEKLDQDLLIHILGKILKNFPLHPSSLSFTQASARCIHEPLVLINILIPLVYEIAYSAKQHLLAIQFCEVGLSIAPENLELLRTTATFYGDLCQYEKSLPLIELCYSKANNLPDKVYVNHKLIQIMLSSEGYHEKIDFYIKRQEELLAQIITNPPKGLGTSAEIVHLYNSTFYFPYLRDKPEVNIQLRHEIALICQDNIVSGSDEEVKQYRHNHLIRKTSKVHKKRIKIGYVSHCLRRHSVGWIARWLFNYHNRERFEIYAYLLASQYDDEPLLQWYASKADKAYKYGLSGLDVAKQINEDEVDILIDLDSTTLNSTCAIMALKPAPIQATWLGWDASEIPTIDYFIADPYVLPEEADNYYSEKIWRLPQSYVAVDGFEVNIPSLRRSDLDVPNDAVIYFSTQRGPKYNAHTVRLQMQILREVPNSYFLIKGSFGQQESLKNLFSQIAEEEGVSANRLRFLPSVTFEETHRANLGIADIVLDTYPYNGATTTLETLWMAIPIVTRVGQQFAARNSYTMMINAGITEGIAWTDEEYVDWGIRLGKDENLRQQVAWKLKKNKQTAPLWNAKRFTREIEKAYEQMWTRYLEAD